METVQMTEQERKEFEAFRAEKAKKEAEERRKQQRSEYAEMVDDEIRTAIPMLRDLSEQIKTIKSTVFGNFDTILKIKSDILGLTKDDQRSHTFTTSDSKLRLTLIRQIAREDAVKARADFFPVVEDRADAAA